MKTIKCPICGSENIDILVNNMMECQICGSRFYVTEKELKKLKGGLKNGRITRTNN